MQRPRSVKAIRVAGGDTVEMARDMPGDCCGCFDVGVLSRRRFGLPEYDAPPWRGTPWARCWPPATRGDSSETPAGSATHGVASSSRASPVVLEEDPRHFLGILLAGEAPLGHVSAAIALHAGVFAHGASLPPHRHAMVTAGGLMAATRLVTNGL